MKKFLGLEFPSSHREPPHELDAKILAAAAMRGNIRRKKRVAVKITLSSVAAAATAAAIVVIVSVSSAELNRVQDNRSMVSSVKKQTNIAAAINKTPVVTVPEVVPPVKNNTNDLLALADTTVLDQESYNLAVMDFSFDGENITI